MHFSLVPASGGSVLVLDVGSSLSLNLRAASACHSADEGLGVLNGGSSFLDVPVSPRLNIIVAIGLNIIGAPAPGLDVSGVVASVSVSSALMTVSGVGTVVSVASVVFFGWCCHDIS